MLEVEMKFPVDDFRPLELRMAEWKATALDPREDADTYFNAPDRDFARTDEALRIRQIGTENRVTYKGPKIDSETKTRTEIEVELTPGNAVATAFGRLLQCLGYRRVATVHKKRRAFEFSRNGFALELTFDNVDGVGTFVEVEIQAEERKLEDARQTLMDVAKDLGLSTSERRSYLEMLLARQSSEKS